MKPFHCFSSWNLSVCVMKFEQVKSIAFDSGYLSLNYRLLFALLVKLFVTICFLSFFVVGILLLLDFASAMAFTDDSIQYTHTQYVIMPSCISTFIIENHFNEIIFCFRLFYF